MHAVKVSTRGDYASRALLSLALHAEESGPTSVRDIAERTGLPQPYLEQILLALKGAGLVRSKRGVGGGYVLGSAFLTAEGTLDQSPVVRVGLIVVGLAWFLVMRRVLHDRMAQRVKTEAAPEAAVLDAERVPRERDPLE